MAHDKAFRCKVSLQAGTTVEAGRGNCPLCDRPCNPGAVVTVTHSYNWNVSPKAHVSPGPWCPQAGPSGAAMGAKLRLCPPSGGISGTQRSTLWTLKKCVWLTDKVTFAPETPGVDMVLLHFQLRPLPELSQDSSLPSRGRGFSKCSWTPTRALWASISRPLLEDQGKVAPGSLGP